MKKTLLSMIINAAIQLVPLTEKEEAYSLVDRAIRVIQNSGLAYEVCPFETVVEGEYKKILGLIDEIYERITDDGEKDFLLNLKLQFGDKNNNTINEKMAKYRK